ncbi:acyl-CoA dehydrogenase family protein [Bordetella genomosp. 11]|uniref:Pimeloyl-CoA dehydrogenase large subunit n=1 Tax=Bordetella genomosp. 11 TaxID=1416808 RepID=A0A261UEB5_9BORD|nr:acyl-CoA dehydrogenase family protein [Bordetella genomosp. 11]OZI59570.1 pimeloyl-CoA dehydrogenase large subunit [Bordetella genomosp. 11]
MDLSYSPQDLEFRNTVVEWLRENLPNDLRTKVLNHKRLDREDFVRWHKIVAAQGWAGASWPVEYGGTGWNTVQRHIWDEACAAAGAPIIMPFGVNMVAPVIMAFGTDAQKRHYLPRILNCDDWWCQGYSEPGAGSDLAAIKTRAERAGDHYIVNGQKTWTTWAQYANMIFCLVRTDPTARKQEGISFILMDMNSPGITVRPIVMLDEEHEVNEVFFDNVKVPAQNLIGEENKGWTYAKYLLGHERTNIAAVGRSKRELRSLKRLAYKQRKNGESLLKDPLFAAKVASLEIDLMGLEMLVLKTISLGEQQKSPTPEASMLKVKGSEIQLAIAELMLESVGPYGSPFDPAFIAGERDHSVTENDDAAPLASLYFNSRKIAIYGGSNEIQKNVIAKLVLGL